ncbi:MAG: SPOR domain-containing protein [Calditrichaeota bacterium]|nr:MAG: SPOR domain-containing protein [Calditrichota bacterium]
MGKDKKVKSLLEASEGIGKLLMWIGIIGLIGMAYSFGKKGTLITLKDSIVNVCRSMTGAPGRPIPPPLSIEGYAVLIGTYNEYADAHAWVKKLSKRRINSMIERQRGRYFVLVGPFTSKKRAEHAYAMVKSNGFPARLISPRKRGR